MPEYVSGIWMALRHTSNDDVICTGCTKPIPAEEIYNERTIGTPLVLCHTCIEEMIDSRLEAIDGGV